MQKKLWGIVLAGLLLTGCATSQEESTERSDPFEGFNRAMFSINYGVLDPYLLRPVAVVWRDYLPQPARNGLVNFFTNLSEPASMVNSFLVGDVYKGFKHFNRFFLNTVVGMGGLIDVASMANPQQLGKMIQPSFGDTLGNYGVGYGPYLVLPGYGGFTLRQDAAGYTDQLYPPLMWITGWMSAGKWLLQGIETRAQLLNSDALISNSPDPYIFLREAYFQHHEFIRNDGKVPAYKNPNEEAIKDDLGEID